jgi:hypothetical protein
MRARGGFQKELRLLFVGVGSFYGAPASATIGHRGRLRGAASCAGSMG